MAQTRYVELRDGEGWLDVAGAFMDYCHNEKEVRQGGCHEGDAVDFAEGRRYAALCIPEHHLVLLDYLHEWGVREGRVIRS